MPQGWSAIVMSKGSQTVERVEPRPNGAGGRPRDAAASRAILDATVALTAELGISNVTVRAIAARSGAAMTTIYRRWSTKEELIAEALRAASPVFPVPETGSLREDLVQLLKFQIHTVKETLAGQAWLSLIAEAVTDPTYATLLAETQRQPLGSALQLIRNAIERGELRSDTDPQMLLELVSSPVWIRLLVDRGHIPRNFAARVVDRVLLAFQ